MKKFAFRTLSILLVAVLLAAALPLAAFAEDVSPCAVTPPQTHVHMFEVFYPEECDYDTNEYHYRTQYKCEMCIWCGLINYKNEIDSWPEAHEFDDSIVDPEVDMDAVCIHCGETFYW